jgi:hypothetical protein
MIMMMMMMMVTTIRRLLYNNFNLDIIQKIELKNNFVL